MIFRIWARAHSFKYILNIGILTILSRRYIYFIVDDIHRRHYKMERSDDFIACLNIRINLQWICLLNKTIDWI